MQRPPTLQDRLHYKLDNVLSRGPTSLLGWLGLFTLILVGAIALLNWLFRFTHFSLGQLAWMSLLRTLDPGTMSGDQGDWRFLASMLFVTVAGIVITSTLIGIIDNTIEERIERLRKGRSRVLENGHTVILGWTKEIFTILEELVITNIHKRNPRVVVLADRDKVKMEDEVRERVGNTRNTRIICRTGHPLEFKDLSIANLETARSIIILSPGDENPDSEVIKTLLAIVNNPDRRPEPYHIVAVVREPSNFEVARMVGRDEVELLLEDDVVSRIIAQTCRQSGLSVVYEEVLDYAGDEFYFHHLPGLAGKTFEDVMFSLKDCCIIGIRRAEQAMLNPPFETVLNDSDEIICLAEDDEHITAGADARQYIDEATIAEAKPEPRLAERTLILGFNRRTHRVINELDRYVAPGSLVKVVTDFPGAEALLSQECDVTQNLTLEFSAGEVTSRPLLERLEPHGYDRLVLMCDARLSPQQADSRVLITLLHLRDLGERCGHRLTVISEMVDPNNCRLASVARADDFIVGSRLVSFLLTQISESKGLIDVFSELFDAEGQEIYLKPAELFVQLETPVTFASVMEAARRRGEIAIGYRIAAEAERSDRAFGVVLNPAKADRCRLGQRDRIVVVAGG